jgi:chromosome partitioning protein
MIKIGIVSGKGGVGKTTTVATLAALFSEDNKKVLMIDTDSQGNLTTFYQTKPCNYLIELFEGKRNVNDCIVSTPYKNLYLIPGSYGMTSVDKALSQIKNRESLLSERLKKLDESFDFVLMDTPPSLDNVPQNVIVASDWVLVPLEASQFSIHGAKETLATIMNFKNSGVSSVKILGLLLTRVNLRTSLLSSVKDFLKKEFGDLLFDSEIRSSVAIAECETIKKPINIYMSKSNCCDDYRSTKEEIFKRIKR